jgi:hypothetical protein
VDDELNCKYGEITELYGIIKTFESNYMETVGYNRNDIFQKIEKVKMFITAKQSWYTLFHFVGYNRMFYV